MLFANPSPSSKHACNLWYMSRHTSFFLSTKLFGRARSVEQVLLPYYIIQVGPAVSSQPLMNSHAHALVRICISHLQQESINIPRWRIHALVLRQCLCLVSHVMTTVVHSLPPSIPQPCMDTGGHICTRMVPDPFPCISPSFETTSDIAVSICRLLLLIVPKRLS
jgi:hypothetical protein